MGIGLIHTHYDIFRYTNKNHFPGYVKMIRVPDTIFLPELPTIAQIVR